MLTKVAQGYVDSQHGTIVPVEITPNVGDTFGPWVVTKVGDGPVFGIVYGADCFPTGTQLAFYGQPDETFEIEESGYFRPVAPTAEAE